MSKLASMSKCMLDLYQSELLGKAIEKEFQGYGLFKGNITDIWETGAVFYAHIEYEDGDEEDLGIATARTLLIRGVPKEKPLPRPIIKKEASDDKRRKRQPPGSPVSKATAASSSLQQGSSKKQKKAERYHQGRAKKGDDDDNVDEESEEGSKAKGGQRGRIKGLLSASENGKQVPEVKGDPYLAGVRKLIRSRALQAGECQVCVTYKNKTFYGDLLPNGTIKYQGRIFPSAEDFAVSLFPLPPPPPAPAKQKADEGTPHQQGITKGQQEEERGLATIDVKIAGKPVEYWEELMFPSKKKGGGGGGAAAEAAPMVGRNHEMEREGDVVVVTNVPDDETARRWLKQAEKAVAVLETIFEKTEAMGGADGGGSSGSFSRDAKKRLDNIRLLNSCVTKLETSLESSTFNAQQALVTAPSSYRPPLDKQFGAEVLRLHWLPWLHAEIEQKLRGATTGANDLQDALAKSLEAQSMSENEKGTTSTVQLARLADYRYQLRHMLSRARDILLKKQENEGSALVACRACYDEQSRIFESVKDHEQDTIQQKGTSESGLERKIQQAETEEKRLLQQLEKTRAELAASKQELGRINVTNDANVDLLKRKTQRWKDKLLGTHQAYQSVQERVSLLEDLNKYMDGMQLEKPLTELLQAYLSRVSTSCCEKWASNNADLISRCFVRLTYEYFTLVKRLWGGDIPVKVKDLNGLQEAFSSVFLNPEKTLLTWVGMPLSLPSTYPAEGSVKILRQATQAISEAEMSQAGFYTENGREGKKPINEEGIRSNFEFQTVVLAHKGAVGSGIDKHRFTDMLQGLGGDDDAAGEEGDEKKGQERSLQYLIFPDAVPLGVPHFLSECLLLVHSQDYLCRLAQVSRGQGGDPTTTIDDDDDESKKMASEDDEETAVLMASSDGMNGHGRGGGGGAAAKGGPKEGHIRKMPSHRANSKTSTTLVPPWWEEIMSGEKSLLSAGSFADSVKHVALVCKAVDLVMLADPPSPLEQQEENPSGPRSTNVVCLVNEPGHVAGRYGTLEHAASFPSSSTGRGSLCLLNNAAVAIMYFRMIWGIRRVAVIDLDISTYGQGTDEVLKGDIDGFYASVHAASEIAPRDCHENTRVLVTLKGKYPKDSFRKTMTEVILPAVEAYFPSLIILSTGLGQGEVATEYFGADGAEEMAWATKQMSTVAEQLCGGRLITLLELPRGGAAGAGGANKHQQALQRHVQALRSWEKVDLDKSSEEQ